jgi:hypothetical protein
VNAPSAFEVVSYREGKFRRATFKQGKLKTDKQQGVQPPTAPWSRFTPDPRSSTWSWHEEFIGTGSGTTRT